MSRSAGYRLYLTEPARRDITDIDRYTLRTFGVTAADRYDALIRRALRDIQEEPGPPGAKSRSDIGSSELRFYHLLHSRHRVNGEQVKAPRHFIVYRSGRRLLRSYASCMTVVISRGICRVRDRLST